MEERNEKGSESEPGQFTKDLDDFTADTLDRLWWTRLAELCRKRDFLQDELERINAEIAVEPEAGVKQRLAREKESFLAQCQAILKTLEEMNWTQVHPPDLTDREALAAYRAARDDTHFKTWSAQVLTSARTRLGALPWERTR